MQTTDEQAFALAVVHAARAETAAERTRAALALYDLGVPSANPDLRMRALTEQHRWGRHDRPLGRCPVCQRAVDHDRIEAEAIARLTEATDALHLGHS